MENNILAELIWEQKFHPDQGFENCLQATQVCPDPPDSTYTGCCGTEDAPILLINPHGDTTTVTVSADAANDIHIVSFKDIMGYSQTNILSSLYSAYLLH